ncbi:Phosphatidylinositol 4-phosphate 3-kinase C2 domain-containing subunit alpha [Liparis tanakae]|uniref:Phosphatidylinositol 4-phosphate 3-kinase C2 domain-containing subunit alpha n=1 Tax=Liparis tanakae TaxID=230148 RepID=A0A4Z2G6J0_9TELE|nr:Phosphatidylinositol 4-phosphate 3-kinase C2 domain-containing subunit alpha [Liparis tanakae]
MDGGDPPSIRLHDKGKGKGLVKNAALEEQDAQNLEVVAFCEDVAALRSKFPHGDVSTNPGFVLSPVMAQRGGGGDNSCSVKVSIEISESQQPVTFTCDGKHPRTPSLMSREQKSTRPMSRLFFSPSFAIFSF